MEYLRYFERKVEIISDPKEKGPIFFQYQFYDSKKRRTGLGVVLELREADKLVRVFFVFPRLFLFEGLSEVGPRFARPKLAPEYSLQF